MTITHREFLRLLPAALRGLDYEKKARLIFARDGPRTVQIHLADESVRKIGSLILPVTLVSVSLHGFSESESLQFMARFDLAYQKGGG